MIKPLIILILFLWSSLVANAEESNSFPLHFGVSAGYILGYSQSENYLVVDATDVYYTFQDLFNEKFCNGFYFGGNAVLDIYTGKKTSHTILIHGLLEYFSKTINRNQPSEIFENGQIKTINIEQDFSFSLSYLTFETFYKFNFANKHIGLFIGPSYSLLINNSYKISNETIKNDTLIISRGNNVSGEFHGLMKSNLMIYFGIEFVINLDDIELVPSAIYYFQDRNIGLPYEWTLKNIRLGIDLRFL
jgi:hypothetical protein